MKNPFIFKSNKAQLVRGILEKNLKNDYIVFNYEKLGFNYSDLRVSLQYVCNKYFNGMRIKTAQSEDKSELWVKII